MVLDAWTNGVDWALARLESAGVTVVQKPHDTGNVNRAVFLRDPDGNLVEIVAKIVSLG